MTKMLGRCALAGLVIATSVAGAPAAWGAPEPVRVRDVAQEAGTQLRELFLRRDRNGDGVLEGREAPAFARGLTPLTFEAYLRALDAPRRTRTPNPVLILPGFLMPEWCYVRLKERLERSGYTDVTVLRGWPWVRSIAEYAQAARVEAERMRARTGARKVDLVGHSMGGLVARYMIQALGYEAHVDHLVTFGTPHHGTEIAPLSAWYAASAVEMTPGSAFLQALNEQEGRPSAVKYTSLHAAFDEIVVPAESVTLAGAANGRIAGSGHIMAIYMPELARSVLEALEE